MDSSCCDARAYMLGAQFLCSRGRLDAFCGFEGACGFTAHGCMACDWLLWAAAVATLATHPMRTDATADFTSRALRGARALNIYRTVR
jgi:hypothetical protein